MPRVVTTLHEPAALALTCRRMHLAPPTEGSARHEGEEVFGWVVRLPGVSCPVVCDTITGLVAYHPRDGAHEPFAQIMRWVLRCYEAQFDWRRARERRTPPRKHRARRMAQGA